LNTGGRYCAAAGGPDTYADSKTYTYSSVSPHSGTAFVIFI
jgi:hypothetical protein